MNQQKPERGKLQELDLRGYYSLADNTAQLILNKETGIIYTFIKAEKRWIFPKGSNIEDINILTGMAL